MKDKTLALLVAGRALDPQAVTLGALRRMREVAAAVPGLAVVAGGDETLVSSDALDDPLDFPVVVGFVAARAQSESEPDVTADPLPVDPSALDASLEKARALGPFTWKRIADVVGHGSAGAALQRAPDRIHLVASGRLSSAVLARGESRPLPLDEEGDFEEGFDEDAWVYHGGNNEMPARGVFGEEVARVTIEGRGEVALSEDELEGDLFLLAVYD